MEKLGNDIFTCGGKTNQMIMDYHTGFPWVKHLKTQEAEELITHLQEVCDTFRCLIEIVSDHSSQYLVEEFQRFCTAFNINHLPGIAYSQWKNSRCKRMTSTFENLMEKSKGEDVDMHDITIALHDTPLASNLASPYELIFNQRVKSDLPALPLQFYQSAVSERAGLHTKDHADFKNHLERNMNSLHCIKISQCTTLVYQVTRNQHGLWVKLLELMVLEATLCIMTPLMQSIPEIAVISG